MDKMEFYQNYLTVYEIGEDEKSLLPIEYGIEKVDPNFTEEKDEKSYWSDKGGSTVTTQGIKIDFAFSGDRAYGAPDQEYIRSKLLDANDRKCYFKVTEADGKILEGLATIIDVKPFGGDANAKAEFSFGVSFSGMPKETIPEKKNNLLRRVFAQ